MVPKASKFPSGIKGLADYVHSKGLKLGIYSDAGYTHLDPRVALIHFFTKLKFIIYIK